MLRRRPDDTFELRFIEEALHSFAPPRLSAERKEALRLRIMSSLGEQEQKQPGFGILPRERWVLVPAGIGIIATILAAAKAADH